MEVEGRAMAKALSQMNCLFRFAPWRQVSKLTPLAAGLPAGAPSLRDQRQARRQWVNVSTYLGCGWGL